MNPVRILKLFLISVVVFGVILFCLSLLFPSTTYVSRAVNVKAEIKNGFKEKYTQLENLHKVAFEDKKNPTMGFGDTSGKKMSDTLILPAMFSNDVLEGIALHPLSNDSTAIQVFYKIHVPFYKPWKKFVLMLNETKYGPSLDSAISRISREF